MPQHAELIRDRFLAVYGGTAGPKVTEGLAEYAALLRSALTLAMRAAPELVEADHAQVGKLVEQVTRIEVIMGICPAPQSLTPIQTPAIRKR